jgi:hypothetical protein
MVRGLKVLEDIIVWIKTKLLRLGENTIFFIVLIAVDWFSDKLLTFDSKIFLVWTGISENVFLFLLFYGLIALSFIEGVHPWSDLSLCISKFIFVGIELRGLIGSFLRLCLIVG